MSIMGSNDRTTTDNLADRIRDSAYEDIRRFGVLGLRVTRVANRAHCSVTQIYRHFGDRDGLLADVLARIFEQISIQTIEFFRTSLLAKPEVRVRDIVELLPTPSGVRKREESLLRAQILAVASTNPTLHSRLEEIVARNYPRWVENCEIAESRLAPGEHFDRRVIFIVLMNSNLYYNSLLGGNMVTDEQYREFMHDILSSRR